MPWDVIVIGAGIAGASAAAALAEHGRVLLIERESQPGYHTTGRSAALYTPHYGASVVRRLNLAGGAFYASPPDGFAELPLLRPRGALYIAGHDGGDILATELAAARLADPSVRELTAADACRLVPILRPDYLVAAYLDAAAADMEVGAILQGFLRLLGRRDGAVRSGVEVQGIDRVAGIWRVRLRDGVEEAPVIVDAAGAWADEFAALAGAGRKTIEPRRRTAILVEPPPGAAVAAWPAVANLPETFYSKPDAGMILASPADETPSTASDAQPDELDVAICVDRIETATTLRVRRIAHRWAGLRSFAPDRIPVVGFDAEVPGFFWLAGQGGYGIMSAPALAAITAHLVAAAPLPAWLGEVDLTALDPARFAGPATLA